MNSARIAPVALYEEVAERLRQRIFSHEIQPGSWIDEQALAQQYGISRTPLREALKVLAAEGLVTLKPRRGCYVTEISESDLDEIFTVLALLEGHCAGEAARRATASDLLTLGTLHSELETAADEHDIETFFEINQAFHHKVQEMAGNRWAVQAIDDLRKVIKLSRHNSLSREGRLQQSLDEHRAILHALTRKEPVAASEAMAAHIRQGRTAASARLAPQPPANDAVSAAA